MRYTRASEAPGVAASGFPAGLAIRMIDAKPDDERTVRPWRIELIAVYRWPRVFAALECD